MATWLTDSIDDANLCDSVKQLVSRYPDSLQVVRGLVSYYDAKLANRGQSSDQDRDRKKRKVSSDDKIKLTIPDLSFQLPTRKKYTLNVTATQLQLVNAKDDMVEHDYPLDDFQIGTCVPNPESKTSVAHVFALFSKHSDTDPVVFNVPEKGDLIVRRVGEADRVLTHDKHTALCNLLSKDANITLTLPKRSIFQSTGVSATTGKTFDTDKCYASAYLKAKEGSLFFLPNGILYGFKKPTVYFPSSCIESTFVCGITQRTFDLTLKLKHGHHALGSSLGNAASNSRQTSSTADNEQLVEIRFSMIEQSEFDGITVYIQKLGINDQSMSEENKAVETKPKKEEADDEIVQQGSDDEENDQDFMPSEDDHENDSLEYDSNACSDEEAEEQEFEDSDLAEDAAEEMPAPLRNPAHSDSEDDQDELLDSD